MQVKCRDDAMGQAVSRTTPRRTRNSVEEDEASVENESISSVDQHDVVYLETRLQSVAPVLVLASCFFVLRRGGHGKHFRSPGPPGPPDKRPTGPARWAER